MSVSGTYVLGANGFNNYQLYLDDKLIVVYDDIHHPVLKAEPVELEAGRLYRIRLDTASYGLDPQIELLWSMPHTDYETKALEMAQKADAVIHGAGIVVTGGR